MIERKEGSKMKPRPNIGDVLSGTAKRRMKLGLNVRTKLLGGYIVGVVFVIVIFVVASTGLHAVGNSGHVAIAEMEYLNKVLYIRTLVAEEWQLYTDYSLNHDAASLEKAREKGQAIMFQSEEFSESVSAANSAGIVEALDRFFAAHQQFVNDNEAAIVASGGGNWVSGGYHARIVASSELLYSALADVEIGVGSEVMSALADVDSTQNSAVVVTAALAGLALLVAAGLGLFLSQRISNGVTSINKAMKQVATGDLTAEVKAGSSDELGEMGITYKKMVTDLSGVIDNVRHSATRLASASRQLACAAEQAGMATKRTAVVSQNVSVAAIEKYGSVGDSGYPVKQLYQSRDQAVTDDRRGFEEVEGTTSVIDYLSNTTQQLTDRAQSVASGTVRTAAVVKNGMDRLDNTVHSLRKIAFAMDDVAEAVSKVYQHSAKLNDIMPIINKIAERTNLIVGKVDSETNGAEKDNGSYTAIVTEAKQLAEQTSGDARSVTDSINAVLRDVKQCLKATQDGIRQVEEGYKLASTTGADLYRVMDAVEETSEQVDQLLATAEKVNKFGIETNNTIESVIGEVISSSRLLAQMSRDLQISVAMFKIISSDGNFTGQITTDKETDEEKYLVP